MYDCIRMGEVVRSSVQKTLASLLCEVPEENIMKSKHFWKKWVIWQLADDPATYGKQAGEFIVTTADGETEICGVCLDKDTASHIVALHNAFLEPTVSKLENTATAIVVTCKQ